MHKEHHVGVLFDRTGFTQVGKLRLLILTHFGTTVQLAQRHHRHFQFLGKQLQCTREVGHFLLAAFHGLAGSHELQVVDHH